MSGTPPVPPKRPGLAQLQVIKAATDYSAKSPDELSFQAGAIIFVIDQRERNAGRCRCKCDNRDGYIPTSVLDESAPIENPLHDAARRGNLVMLKALITSGMSVNTLDHAGNVPLYCAARAGHLDCVKILLAANPVLGQQNKLGDTILHGAAWGGHLEILKTLLQQPDIDNILTSINKEGKTALQLAKNTECGALLQTAMDACMSQRPTSYMADSDDENN